jgi:hypothetical protein
METGYQGLKGPKNVLTEAYRFAHIQDGEVWTDMLQVQVFYLRCMQ